MKNNVWSLNSRSGANQPSSQVEGPSGKVSLTAIAFGTLKKRLNRLAVSRDSGNAAKTDSNTVDFIQSTFTTKGKYVGFRQLIFDKLCDVVCLPILLK